MDAKGIKTACIFSHSGFTSISIKEIEYQYLNGKYIIPIEVLDLKCINERYLPIMLIEKKIKSIQKKI